MHRRILSVTLSLCLVGCSASTLVGQINTGTDAPFKLQVIFEGSIAFIRSEQLALLVNATTMALEDEPLDKHFAAIRFPTKHFFQKPETFASQDAFTLIPLTGVDISISANCTPPSGVFSIDDHEARLPKIKSFSPGYSEVCPGCKGGTAGVPPALVSARYKFSGGPLVLTKPITYSTGRDIDWCFTDKGHKPTPTQYICPVGSVRQNKIAQRATTDLQCSGTSLTISLQSYSGSPLPITLYPDGGKIVIEILNVRAEDLALPGVNGPVKQDDIAHFKWFYKLSKNVPAEAERRYPNIAQDPELGGKPYCSLVEME